MEFKYHEMLVRGSLDEVAGPTGYIQRDGDRSPTAYEDCFGNSRAFDFARFGGMVASRLVDPRARVACVTRPTRGKVASADNSECCSIH
ncbi:hypothetical protein PoMZ_13744 [Pyricularia oryzae]|uniref:Uncharacterized protein n=1 Tax=Pyricularia oryzae TaxID=318829 RepID=A0A4P7NVY2_PYROR|nr:hypothetical protein PoMZ_13744 [Pyricularia oryzae]